MNHNNGFYLPKRIVRKPLGYQTQHSRYLQQLELQRQYAGTRLLDWGLLFNLSIFVIFFGSLFYICVHRYHNKEHFQREKEIRKQELVDGFTRALKQQQKYKLEQELRKKSQNQVMMTQSLENLKHKLGNVINQDNFGNQYQRYQENYKVDSYQPIPYQSPFFNSGSLINQI